MGLYLRGKWYHYKKTIQGKTYYIALKIKKGQEHLLSSRLQQVEEEIIAKHFNLPYSPIKQITFEEFKQRYIEFKKHKKSLDRDIQRLEIVKQCWGNPLLNRIDRKYVEKLENFLFEKNKKPATVNRYFALLRTFFNLAIEENYIQENPIRYYSFFVESPKRRALNFDEIRKVLYACKKIEQNPKSPVQAIIYDLVLFALNTAMRLSEILTLRKSYIQNDMIFYPISKTKYKRRGSSSKKVKIIVLNSISKKIIEKYQSGENYVFPLKNRKPNILRRTVKRIRKETDINDFSFHMLRHTVSTLISSQVDLISAKAILGHEDLRTTLQYTHPQLNEQRKAVAKLETIFFDEIINNSNKKK